VRASPPLACRDAMPASFAIDVSRRLVLSRGWGVLSVEELMHHVRALPLDPRFSPGFRQLIDLTEVSGLDLDAEDLRRVAALNPFGRGARRAVAVTNDEVYGMARMYEMVRPPVGDELRIFRGLTPAVEWLGLADEESEVLVMLREAEELKVRSER